MSYESIEDENRDLYARLWLVLDDISKRKAVISYSCKVRFLDKSSIEYSYKNPDFVKLPKPA